MKKHFMKQVSFLTAFVMLAAIFAIGCKATPEVTSSASSQESASASQTQLDPVDLVWCTRCGQQDDLSTVLTEINKYLKEKINATLDLVFIDTGSYDQVIKTKMASSDAIDIVFTSNWVNDYGTNVAKGAFLALDDLLKTYAPKSYAAIPENFWDATKINNKIYGFINYQIVARQMAFSIQKDMVDKYSINMKSIKTLEDAASLLKTIADGESGDSTIFEMSKDGIFTSLLHYYGLEQIGVDNSPGALYVDDDTLKVINQFEQPEFKKHVELMRAWYNAGYIEKDAATITNLVDPRLTGKVLSFVTDVKPGGSAEVKIAMGGKDMIDQALDEPFVQTNSILATMNAIPVSSKNPERAMMLLELVNTDKYLNNLINFGIEDVHYKKVSDDSIEMIADSGYAPNRAWTFGTQFLAYYLPGQETGIWEETIELNGSAEVSKIQGFVFNSEPVKAELAQCQSVVDEYGPGLWTGSVDPNVVLPEFIAKLKAAGSEKIIAEKQKQLNEWKASLK